MGSATGLTAAEMQAIRNATIVGAAVNAEGYLILTQFDGTQVNAGYVQGSTTPETADATPSTLMRRDANAQSKVADPTDDAHVSTKAYTDTGDAQALSDAADYTDQEVSSANAYTDQAVADGIDAIIRFDQTITQDTLPSDIPEGVTFTYSDGTLASFSDINNYSLIVSTKVGSARMTQVVYLKDNSSSYIRKGYDDTTWSEWATNDGMPIGTITMNAYSVDTVPAIGWLRCYGQAVSRTTYSRLFSVIGTSYGTGDGSTTFNLPDFRYASPVGAYGIGDFALAAQSGSGSHTHTMGSHTHTIASHTHTMPSHSHALSNAGWAEVAFDIDNDWLLANINTANGSFQANRRTGTGTLTVGTSTVSGNSGVVLGGDTDSKDPGDTNGSGTLTTSSVDPGDTNSTSSYHPYVGVTFMIKAF